MKGGYARLCLGCAEVPNGAIVFIEKRVGTRTLFQYGGKRYVRAIGDRSLFWFPPHQQIVDEVVRHNQGVLIVHNLRLGCYQLAGMDYGLLVRAKQMIFENGKMAGSRPVYLTEPLLIKSPTERTVMHDLLCFIVAGKLYQKIEGNRFNRLVYDSGSQTIIAEEVEV